VHQLIDLRSVSAYPPALAALRFAGVFVFSLSFSLAASVLALPPAAGGCCSSVGTCAARGARGRPESRRSGATSANVGSSHFGLVQPKTLPSADLIWRT